MKKPVRTYDFRNEDWKNLKILSRNRLPMRTFTHSYTDEELTHHQSINLDGIWRFRFLENPFMDDGSFARPDADERDWDSIQVPSHWQLSGHGRPQYTDAVTPFPGIQDLRIQNNNPTGLYRRRFSLERDETRRYVIRFEGVESAFHFYMNGKLCGYGQGSRLTSEFDVTRELQDGENVLAVKAYQFSDGSSLENQDMWWLSGIFRNVSLLNLPCLGIADFHFEAPFDGFGPDGKGPGQIEARIQVGNHLQIKKTCRLTLTVSDGRKSLFREQQTLTVSGGEETAAVFRTTLDSVEPWSAENPRIYKALWTLESDGLENIYVPHSFGFRTVGMKDGLIHLNGVPITLRGVNRHDWSEQNGRAVTEDDIHADLRAMKAANINAVRCSHYPNLPVFYELCTQIGFYVMDEADLEANQCYYWQDPNRISSDPQWLESYLDRVLRMVARDRNHTCILFWSLGNESGYGSNFQEAYKHVKNADPTRPVHYEEDRDAETADMYSTMYTPHRKLEELGMQNKSKPHILCEYAHAMGNGPGGLESYWDIINRYPRLQGGFIWEWKNQTLPKKLPDGTRIPAYGGDFGDSPNSGPFCADGLVQSDGTPTPGLVHVKKAYEPIRAGNFNMESGQVTIKNRFDFRTLSGCICAAEVHDHHGFKAREILQLPPIQPGKQQDVSVMTQTLREAASSSRDEWILKLMFLEGDSAELGFSEFIIPAPAPSLETPKTKTEPVEIDAGNSRISIRAGKTSVIFNALDGELHQLSYGNQTLINRGSPLDFWRTPTDNDAKTLPGWQKAYLDHVKTVVDMVEVNRTERSAKITCRKTYVPIVAEWRVDTEEIWTIDPDGTILLSVKGTPSGDLPESFPRIGFSFRLPQKPDEVVWFGRQGESYADAKAGTPTGLHRAGPEAFHFPYTRPQENGQRCDVRWLTLSGPGGEILSVAADTVLGFSLGDFSRKELERAGHDHELQASKQPYLRLDWAQNGLGSASWGPPALPEHRLVPEPFHFRWAFSTIDGPSLRSRLTAERGRSL